ncbi:hypothetical protein [Treponema sp. R80B11-R83G3]
MKSRNIIISLLLCLFVPCAVFGGGSSESSSSQKGSSSSANSTSSQKSASSSASASSSSAVKYWDGDGGKGKSIAILAPSGNGLAKEQDYIPSLVQGEFVSNFSGFSAISVLDRQSLDAQYAELLSGYYDDNAQASKDLGKLSPTDYIMGGKITKTATGYAMQISITKSADKMTAASYSGTMTFTELDNLSGVRRVSLELLQKMGVKPTELAKKELTGAAASNQINAQTALAQGITAQKQGTEVAALSYYFQAATFQPTLAEAANRSSILAANISSGNIGDNIRNDIVWRKAWVDRLTETEQYFNNLFKTGSQPHTLYYSTKIEQGDIDFKKETVSLSFDVYLHPSQVWAAAAENALNTVYEGLNATKRKKEWGLSDWPYRTDYSSNDFDDRKDPNYIRSRNAGDVLDTTITKLKTFNMGSKKFTIRAELLNDRNQVIGSRDFTLESAWKWGKSGDRPTGDDNRRLTFYNYDSTRGNYDRFYRQIVEFTGVKADDITDRLTIRIATVNGVDAQTAAQNGALQIQAVTDAEFNKQRTYNLYFSKGVWEVSIDFGHRIKYFAGYDPSNFINPELVQFLTKRENGSWDYDSWGKSITIPANVWGEPVTGVRFGFLFEKIIIGGNLILLSDVSEYNYDYVLSFPKSSIREFISYYNSNGKKAGVYEYKKGLVRDSWTYKSK